MKRVDRLRDLVSRALYEEYEHEQFNYGPTDEPTKALLLGASAASALGSARVVAALRAAFANGQLSAADFWTEQEGVFCRVTE